VLTHLANVENENDAAVLCKVLQLLVDLAESCESDVFYELINVLKKVCMLMTNLVIHIN